jgi:hypothetical protein
MRDTVAAKMTPPQIAEAQKLAREWKQSYPTPKKIGSTILMIVAAVIAAIIIARATGPRSH